MKRRAVQPCIFLKLRRHFLSLQIRFHSVSRFSLAISIKALSKQFMSSFLCTVNRDLYHFVKVRVILEPVSVDITSIFPLPSFWGQHFTISSHSEEAVKH